MSELNLTRELHFRCENVFGYVIQHNPMRNFIMDANLCKLENILFYVSINKINEVGIYVLPLLCSCKHYFLCLSVYIILTKMEVG